MQRLIKVFLFCLVLLSIPLLLSFQSLTADQISQLTASSQSKSNYIPDSMVYKLQQTETKTLRNKRSWVKPNLLDMNSVSNELSIDNGIVEKSLPVGSMIVMNRLTPTQYPILLQHIRLRVERWQDIQDPTQGRIRLLAFTDPTGKGKPPINPSFVINQIVTVSKINDWVDFEVPQVILRSGDLYLGFQSINAASGLEIATDSSSFQKRTFYSSDNGATFKNANKFAVGLEANLMIRAVYTMADTTQEELKTDDGTAEVGLMSDNLMIVNRLTPSTYPAKLERIRIRFDPFQGYPSPVSKNVRVVIFTDPNSIGHPSNNPNFLLDQYVTIPQTGAFVDFNINNGTTVNSGDIYVGYQTQAQAQGVGFSGDNNGLQQQRAFFSTNQGSTFQGPLQLSNGTNVNIMIRAVVSIGSNTEQELKTDDGSADGLGLLSDGLIVVNKLTPSSYPVTLQRIRAFFVTFSNNPSPVGQRVRLLAFLNPNPTGQLPTNPQFLVDKYVDISQTGTYVDFTVDSISITSGDIYVGYQAPTPANGVGFATDTNGTQQERSFYSTDNGSSFKGPLVFSGGTKANAMIRAVVTQGGSSTGDFSLSLSPSSQTVQPGDTTSFNINVASINGFNQSVGLSAAISPTNSTINTSFSSSSVLPGNSSTLTVRTSSNTPETTFNLSVTGIAGSLTHTQNAMLIVRSAAGLPTVTIVATDAQASEIGTDNGVFTISRSGSTNTALNVNYTISGTASNGVDYKTIPNSVTIAAGSSSATIVITPIDDNTDEGDETIILTLTSGSSYLIGNPSSATVMIKDNDHATPTVTISTQIPSIPEMGIGTFTVTRAGSTTTALNVNYTISGTAVNGKDYVELLGSVTIPDGFESETIMLAPIPSLSVGSSKTCTITLSPNPDYVVGNPNSATISITNNNKLGSGSINLDNGGSIITSDGASATFSPTTGSGDITASLAKTKKPKKKVVDTKKDVSWTYQLDISYTSDMNGHITVVLPVDPTLFPSNSERTPFQAQYLDSKTKTWKPASDMTFFDPASKAAIFDISVSTTAAKASTTNASQASRKRPSVLAAPSSNKLTGTFKVTKYYIHDYVLAERPGSMFHIYYYPTKGTSNSIPEDKDWSACNPVSGAGVPNYVVDVDAAFNSLYKEMLKLPGKPFTEFTSGSDATQVWIMDTGESGGAADLGGPVQVFPGKPRIEECKDLNHVIAHEMVHAFQGQIYFSAIATIARYNVILSFNKWFVDATANYYGAVVNNLSDSEKNTYYTRDGYKKFLLIPLNSWDDESMYTAGFFLEWLSNKYGSDLVAKSWKAGHPTTDIDNLNRAIAKANPKDNLSKAFTDFGSYIITHPDDVAKLVNKIKEAMYNDAIGAQGEDKYLTAGRIDDKTSFISFNKNISSLSMAYIGIDAKNTSDALLVMDSSVSAPIEMTGSGYNPIVSTTYGIVGNSNNSYVGVEPIDKGLSFPYKQPLLIKHFGKDSNGIEQMIINKHVGNLIRSYGVNLNYYILIPPTTKSVVDGKVTWTFSGIGSQAGQIPSSFIAGFNVYNPQGTKLNSDPIKLPASGTELSFSNSTIKAGDKVVVTVVDKYGNAWPEVKDNSVPNSYTFKQFVKKDSFSYWEGTITSNGSIEGPGMQQVFDNILWASNPDLATQQITAYLPNRDPYPTIIKIKSSMVINYPAGTLTGNTWTFTKTYAGSNARQVYTLTIGDYVLKNVTEAHSVITTSPIGEFSIDITGMINSKIPTYAICKKTHVVTDRYDEKGNLVEHSEGDSFTDEPIWFEFIKK